MHTKSIPRDTHTYVAHVAKHPSGELFNAAIGTAMRTKPVWLSETLTGQHTSAHKDIRVLSYLHEDDEWIFNGTIITLPQHEHVTARQLTLILGGLQNEQTLRWHPPCGWTIVKIVEYLNKRMLPDLLSTTAEGVVSTLVEDYIRLQRPLIVGCVH